MKVFQYFFSLYLFFTLSSIQSSEPKKRYKILIPIPCIGGEAEMGVRMERVARKIGWEAQAFYFSSSWKWDTAFDFYRVFKPFEISLESPSTLKDVIRNFCPDFIICLDPIRLTPKKFKIPNFLVLSHNIDIYRREFRRSITTAEGLLCVSKNLSKIEDFLGIRGKTIPKFSWLPTQGKSEYVSRVPRKLFYCGSIWDKLRNSDLYQKCFSMLDKTNLIDIYGPENGQKFLRLNSYKGLLPYDGMSLTRALQNCGISLILHSQEHLEGGVITGRIFEAAAAGCVIISDKHEFIEKEFGDTVLYLDIDKDHKLTGEKMFEQIYAHLMWIFSHPKEAEEKARKAHKIFDDKFTLEAQLERLGEFYENVKSNSYLTPPEEFKPRFLKGKTNESY